MLREKEAPIDHARHLKSGVQYTAPPPPPPTPMGCKVARKRFKKLNLPQLLHLCKTMQGLSYIASIYILKN